MTEKRTDYIPAFALCAALAVYPLLRGGWDLWSQLAVQLFLLVSVCVWVFLKLLGRRLPVPPASSLLPACALLLGFVSVQASPVYSLARPEYQWWAVSVSLAFIVPAMSERWRGYALAALLGAGAATVPLAFYQRFLFSGVQAEATGPFFNANMYAGYLLMLVPLALLRRKWLFSVLLLCGIALSGSRGAWVALVLSSGLWGLCRLRGKFVPALVLLCCGSAAGYVIWRWGGISMHERLGWWHAALAMIGERPLLGFGPGSFEYVFPAFHAQAVDGLSTIYAHSWPLQFAAEYGVPCVLLWLGWAVSRLRSLDSPYRWAVITVFLHSIGDFTLNGPAVFFVFCWLLSCGESRLEEAALPDGRRAFAAAVLVLALSAPLAFAAARPFMAQRRLIAARNSYQSSYPAHDLDRIKRLVIANPDDANAALLLASAMADSAYSTGDKSLLAQAVIAYERALRLNPFRPATYTEMAALSRALGRPQDAELVLRRREVRFR